MRATKEMNTDLKGLTENFTKILLEEGKKRGKEEAEKELEEKIKEIRNKAYQEGYKEGVEYGKECRADEENEKEGGENESQGSRPDDQRKMAEIRDVAAGHTVMIAGIFCTVLDPEFTEEGTLVLARDVLFEKAFDEDNSNDWRGSTLRKYLNGAYLEELTDEMEEDPFLEFERDLTADDGQKNYGTCRDKVSLISCDEYRKYREYIPNKSDWWWTLTSRTPYASNSDAVRTVSTDGTLYNFNAYYGYYGVAPAFCVSSDFVVEVIE